MHTHPAIPDPQPANDTGWRIAAAGVVAVVWAIAAHVASASRPAPVWGPALALAPLVLALAVMVKGVFRPWVHALLALCLLALLWWAWPWLQTRVAHLFFLEHTGVYLLMAAVFGRSLFGGQESLVTQMARQVHGGTLSARQQTYTRKVTVAWTLFFGGMVLTSSILFFWGSLTTWSFVVNLFGGPLIALMFVGEYLCRRAVLPAAERGTLRETWQAWKAHQAARAPSP